MGAEGGGVVFHVVAVEKRDNQVAHGGQELRGAPARHPARVLAKGVVPHPVKAVLDPPVVAGQVQQFRRVGLLG